MVPFSVVLDLDGVICDWTTGLRNVWYELTGEMPELPQVWDIESTYQHAQYNVRDVAFNTHKEEVHLDAPEVEGAVDAMLDLYDQGIRLEIVTARKRPTYDLTRYWLDEHQVPFDALVFTTAKETVPAHLYVDDSPSIIERYQLACCPYIIFDYPYNQGLLGMRANGWDDLKERILFARNRFEERTTSALPQTPRPLPGFEEVV